MKITEHPLLSIDSINPNMKNIEFAVGGKLYFRLYEIQQELANGVSKPFKSVIMTNGGDAQSLGQRPLTFVRQLLACLSDTTLLDSPLYPPDVKDRARDFLAECGGASIGSYTLCVGLNIVRKHVAEFISARDGFPSDPEHICITAGASDAIREVLKIFVRGKIEKQSAVLIPIPQYPLYSASLAELGLADYYLDESQNWSLEESELERAVQDAKERNAEPRVLVVINPGNPTGQVLTRENIEMVAAASKREMFQIIKFAYRHRLFIFADEVYQENIYNDDSAFHSFKKVTNELGSPYDK